jgi:hypothetical protein
VPPGEEHQEQLVKNIRVGDVEVVLERGYVDISTELQKQSSLAYASLVISEESRESHTFCSMYSCPCLKAVWPNWAATWAVGSFMNWP